jgi:hypothetical protein
VAAQPDYIVLERHRDLAGREKDVWVRRGLLVLLALVSVVALANVFGQRATTSRVTVAAGTLDVHAPAAARPGLIYNARFTITATQELRDAALVLDSGWFDGLTVNTIEPSPESETSRNGSVRLALGSVGQGKQFKLFIYYQVNPTTVGRRSQGVELADGDRVVATIHRTLTVYP